MNLNINVFLVNSPGSRRLTRVFLLLIAHAIIGINAMSQEKGKLLVNEIIELHPILTEISGISYVDGKVYSINDSGNRNEVHILDANTFEVLSSEKLSGTRNIDWEDLSSHSNFLYIGDFGNNFGSRNDLAVYKISIDSLKNDRNRPEKITFNYKRQKSFRLTEYKRHPWDCEAMIADDSGIWLFSKDWVDRTCRLYKLADSKRGKKQGILPLDSLKLGYLVTGAFFDSKSGTQFLCGYEGKHTYVTIFQGIEQPTLSGNYTSYRVEGLEYAQVESIFIKDNLMYLASERTGDKQSVYKILLPETGK